MSRFLKISAVLVAGLVLIGLILAYRAVNPKAQIGTGYMTKIICSEVFVAGRNAQSVQVDDFFAMDPILDKASVSIDPSAGTVSAHIYGLGRSTAQHRTGAGCTPVAQGGVSDINVPMPDPAPHQFDIRPDRKTQAVVDEIIADQGAAGTNRSRALLVLKDGEIIAEGYADGFDRETPMQSWSMAKSVTSALISSLIDNGTLALDMTELKPDWNGDDPRAAITLENLLHMNSGLDASEVYDDPTSGVVKMLFRSKDTANFAADAALESSPGTIFEYSSATTNLLSGIMRDAMADDAAYHALPRNALFDPLGMDSAIFELDAAGNFIGSSFVYATARDWARLGQLYLQGGDWNGEQILPQDWVDYSRTPAPASGGDYGAHIWLNTRQFWYPGLPADMYWFGGHEGQHVMIFPSDNLVIVRLGITRAPATYETDLAPAYARIFQAATN